MSAPVRKAEVIASLNDQFRLSLAQVLVPGVTLLTHGIDCLSPAVRAEIWNAVREFSDFTEDNDPYGEHDFGSFDHPEAGKVFWKIDVFADSQCQWGAEHPDDPARSFRVLTVMLAEEY